MLPLRARLARAGVVVKDEQDVQALVLLLSLLALCLVVALLALR